MLQLALFAIAPLLVASNFLAFLSDGAIPRRPVDGVDVEQLLERGAFGSLRPGDVQRLQRVLRRGDRFVVVGSDAATVYGGPRANARLLLGSMLVPSAMVLDCADANVIITLDRSHGRCGVSTRPVAVFRSGVTVYRAKA
jgi:hypothetical protein